MVVVIITSAKEEVRRGNIKGLNVKLGSRTFTEEDAVPVKSESKSQQSDFMI